MMELIAPNTRNIDAIGSDKTSALLFATKSNDIDIVFCLLKYGANPTAAKNAAQWTCLHEATFRGFHEILQALVFKLNPSNPLCRGPDPQCIEGKTPLMIACQIRNLTAIDILKKAGADMSIRCNQNKTCSDYAKENDILYAIDPFHSWRSV